MTEALKINGFTELSNDDILNIEGGNLFGDICKTITQVALGAVVGSAFTLASPAAGYAAAALTYEAVGAAWDAVFKK
jgi:hypothetical protein